MGVESVAIYWHPDVLKHNPGKGCYEYVPSPLMSVDEPHPETAERLINMKSILEKGGIADRLVWCDGRHASREEIERFHTAAYVDSIIEAEKNGPTRIDGGGTVVDTGSVDAAFAAAGSGLAALLRCEPRSWSTSLVEGVLLPALLHAVSLVDKLGVLPANRLQQQRGG